MGEAERHGLLAALCLGLGGVFVIGASNNLRAGLGDDNLFSGAPSITALHQRSSSGLSVSFESLRNRT